MGEGTAQKALEHHPLNGYYSSQRHLQKKVRKASKKPKGVFKPSNKRRLSARKFYDSNGGKQSIGVHKLITQPHGGKEKKELALRKNGSPYWKAL